MWFIDGTNDNFSIFGIRIVELFSQSDVVSYNRKKKLTTDIDTISFIKILFY